MSLKLVPPKEGRSPYWRVRGTYIGQHVDRSTGIRERGKATKALHKIEDEIERGQFSRPRDPTFSSAALAYMRAGGERRFMSALIGHFGETKLPKIDQAAVDRAAIELLPNAVPSTRNRQVYTPVSAILKHAGVHDPIRRPQGSAGNSRVAWLWPEDAERLLTAADEIDAEFGIFCTTLLYTGLRLTELLQVKVADVRLREAYMHVGITKNGEPRSVHLPPVVVAALARHPRAHTAQSADRVFRFSKNGSLYTKLDEAGRRAAVTIPSGVAYHLLRHTWATWMRRYGGLDTAGLVGTGAWRDRKSAARYEHVVVSEEAKKANLLPVPRKIL